MTRLHRLIAALIAAFALLLGPAAAHQLLPAAHATPGSWTLTNAGRTNLVTAAYGNLTTASGATVKLLTSSSNIGASSTTCAGVTGEVASANGYTTGGVSATLVASGTTTVTLTLSANVTFTASGGSIVFRYYLICYNSQVLAYAVGDNTPADITISNGNTETLSNSQPVWTVS